MTVLKVGDTLYRFDGNTRVYPSGRKPYGGVGPIYSKHFLPKLIVGENKVSWLMEDGGKVNKRTLKGNAASYEFGGRGYFTAEAMDDDIWLHEHRRAIISRLENADANTLRRVAEVIGYSAKTAGEGE